MPSPPATGSSDMLRSMLLSAPAQAMRPRSDSNTSSGASSSRRRSSSGTSSTPLSRGKGSGRGKRGGRSASPRSLCNESLLPQASPASSMELQVSKHSHNCQEQLIYYMQCLFIIKTTRPTIQQLNYLHHQVCLGCTVHIMFVVLY